MLRREGELAGLDDTDRRLLRVLQSEGRITNQELAQRIHLSPAACYERTKRLRETGVITGFNAILDPDKIGLGLLIFVEVYLERATAQTFVDFAEAVRKVPAIVECHLVAGSFDYLIKARVKDMSAYRTLLGETLVAIPGVRETKTYPVLEAVKTTTELPL